jgi:alkylation response protein AidB-like acyl-CoA dehydrogenase
MSYQAPVRDLLAALYGPAGFQKVADLDSDLDRDTIEAVLRAAGAFAAATLAPLNRIGDRHGATLENGGVVTAPGFAEAYRAFCADGWNGLAYDPEHGGQGLPKAVAAAAAEMVQAANMALALCPMLTQGAIEALAQHGDARQKALYLPRLVSGEWTGAMALTEAQAGSDLSTLATRAEPDGQGGYRLYGQKIFITWGDHDCAGNILHLVLARLPDAPAGTKGISLFLTSKYRLDAAGGAGDRNAFAAVGLEHKLGIHGSPTCVMQYDGAAAERVGPVNQGLAAMFTMMNAARLQVGVQGVAIADRAFQQALAFCQERRQGRSAFTGAANALLFDHPDVRRMLLLMKARIQGGRALYLSAAVAADLAARSPDPAVREAARLREELLTPIVKAWCTDMGVQVASEALQLQGGMGYVEETGAAQHYRDARIAPIYEGANAIQAIDLAFRKLPMAEGRAVASLLDGVARTAAALQSHPHPPLQRLGARLDAARDAAAQCARTFAAQGRGADTLAGASAFLTLMGDLIAGDALGAQALDDPYGVAAAMAARFGESILAGAGGLAAAALQGAGDLADLSPELLAP